MLHQLHSLLLLSRKCRLWWSSSYSSTGWSGWPRWQTSLVLSISWLIWHNTSSSSLLRWTAPDRDNFALLFTGPSRSERCFSATRIIIIARCIRFEGVFAQCLWAHQRLLLGFLLRVARVKLWDVLVLFFKTLNFFLQMAYLRIVSPILAAYLSFHQL